MPPIHLLYEYFHPNKAVFLQLKSKTKSLSNFSGHFTYWWCISCHTLSKRVCCQFLKKQYHRNVEFSVWCKRILGTDQYSSLLKIQNLAFNVSHKVKFDGWDCFIWLLVFNLQCWNMLRGGGASEKTWRKLHSNQMLLKKNESKNWPINLLHQKQNDWSNYLQHFRKLP